MVRTASSISLCALPATNNGMENADKFRIKFTGLPNKSITYFTFDFTAQGQEKSRNGFFFETVQRKINGFFCDPRYRAATKIERMAYGVTKQYWPRCIFFAVRGHYYLSIETALPAGPRMQCNAIQYFSWPSEKKLQSSSVGRFVSA
jgi:hypothetical protein